MNKKRVNPDEELFWREIRQAVCEVEAERKRIVNVRVGNRRATIAMNFYDPSVEVGVVYILLPGVSESMKLTDLQVLSMKGDDGKS